MNQDALRLVESNQFANWVRRVEPTLEEVIDAVQYGKFEPAGADYSIRKPQPLSTLKKGDKVVMHTCMEHDSPKNYGRVWTCRSDPFRPKGHHYCSIFLDGFSGSFSTEYLQLVKVPQELPQAVVNAVKQALEFVEEEMCDDDSPRAQRVNRFVENAMKALGEVSVHA